MMRRIALVVLLALVSPWAWGTVRCSGTPCLDSSGGTSSPASSLFVFGTGTGAANSVSFNATAGCIEYEGATADAFENLLCSADPTVDMRFNLRAPAFAGTNTLIDNASADNGNQTVAGRLDLVSSSIASGSLTLGIGSPVSVGAVSIFDAARYCWSSTGTAGAAAGTCLAQPVAGVVSFTDGSTGKSYSMNNGGDIALAADFTNATATMANTALSVTLTAARVYTFSMRLFAVDSTAADGVKIDFDGGAATATDFRAHCTIFDTALLASAQTTAIATDFTVAVATGASLVECYGAITANAGGTFIVRAAQVAHTAGTLTINRGSHLWMRDVTP